MCMKIGFTKVRTFIASGNVVFESSLSEARVKSALQRSLAAYTGKPVGVLIRTAAEMEAVLIANPFPNAPRNCTVAIFLDQPPPADALHYATGQKNEEVQLGLREIYVHYGEGMADSRLKIPVAKEGTARNINTIAKLTKMSAALQIHL